MRDELWLFTARFPFGHTESFLENELPVLCRRFARVRIMPLERGGAMRPVPPNADVVDPDLDPFGRAGPGLLLKHMRLFRKLKRSLKAEAPSSAVFQRQWPELRSRIRQLLYRAEVLHRKLFSSYGPDKVVLYSYWTHDWATVLSILGERDPSVRWVSRAHGFDLYEERNTNGWIPFRAFQLDHVHRLFCVSQAGLDHLRSQHPVYTERFELARLGTRDHGEGPWAPVPALRLVSCANLVPLKRVEMLAEVLMTLDIPVEWTHFGDGPDHAALTKRTTAFPGHIRCTLQGAIRNADLLAWYQRTPVDLFVHTSASEGGVPVAMQEAASFGIPLLAIDAGGVREIVNDRTGTLLPADADGKALAHALRTHVGSPWATVEGRAQVRAYWEQHFRAEVNFDRFCDRLLAE